MLMGLWSIAAPWWCMQGVGAAQLWPPVYDGPPETWGSFDDTWTILGEGYASHHSWGGRTVARPGVEESRGKALMLYLPGTFTFPQRYSKLLKYMGDLGLDTLGLDYAWGPAADGGRSAQCAKTSSCDACQENYHEMMLHGQGSDLISGPLPVFGDNITDTLKFVHFFSYNVTWLPEYVPPAGIDLQRSPIPQHALDYLASIPEFSIEPLLIKTLRHLGWREYLTGAGAIDWARVVVIGHSQGATNAAYVAYKRPVLGALILSGPQDLCGDRPASWVAAAATLARGDSSRNICGCWAVDEGPAALIEKSRNMFTEQRTINSTGKTRTDVADAWCPKAAHCATGTDDFLINETVKTCFSFLNRFVEQEINSASTRGRLALSAGSLFFALVGASP